MKKEKVERFAVPELMPERFMGIVNSMVEAFGVDRIPDVMHHVELLGQAVERYVSESPSSEIPDRTNLERRRFVAIFKNRYILQTDLEYTRPITPVDGKLMGQTIGILREKGFDVEEFLKWVFETFLEENSKFQPATIKVICSAFVVERFFLENKDLMRSRKEQAAVNAEAEGILGRARVQIRVMKERGEKKELEKIVELLKNYRDGSIMLDELAMYVKELESRKVEEVVQDGIEE